jgi:hypothetical protein
VHLEGVTEMTSKDRFPNHETICGQCGATIYKPFKELSDEEIIEVFETPFQPNTTGGINDEVIAFARAILKKASEK